MYVYTNMQYIPDPPNVLRAIQLTTVHTFMPLTLPHRHNMLPLTDSSSGIATSTYYLIFAFDLNAFSLEKKPHSLWIAFALRVV